MLREADELTAIFTASGKTARHSNPKSEIRNPKSEIQNQNNCYLKI